MKKIIWLYGIFATVFNVSQAQNPDSLINILNTQKLTPTEQLSIYEQLCNIYSENDVNKCILYAKKGLVVAEKENDKAKASKFNEDLGVSYYTKSIYDTALIHQEKALALAIEINDKIQESSIYTDIGNLYRRQGKYEKAMENYMKTMAISDSLGNKNDYAISMVNISGIYTAMRNNERALHFLKRAEETSREVNNKYLQMTVCYRLGKFYLTEGKNNEAIEQTLIANEISHKYGDKKYEIASLTILATAYANMRNYGKSLEYADEAIQIAEKYGDKRLLMGVLNELSDIYFKQNRYEDCADLSLKVWAMDSTDLVYATDAAWTLSLANIHIGNKGKAVYFLEKFNELVTQRIEKNSQDALIKMEVQYETEKKEIRIAALEQEKQFYIWIGIAGGTVLLLAFGMLFYRHRLTMQKRKVAEQQREIAEQKVQQLEQEKRLIATQAVLEGETAERSRIARDLHDGLGGMLSVVKLNLNDMKNYAIMDGTDVDRFGKALGLLDQSIGELRRVAHHLMPESLMRHGLRVSLEDFCRAIPGTNFQYYGENPRLDNRLEILVYRCAHELVNNAVKHANATTINVQLMVDDGLVSLTVHDNGSGFDPATVIYGSGLENIRTRVSAYNGKLTIHSTPGEGTEISIEIEKEQQ